ncbi:hypothetical protein [Mycobacterium tuberculosis]|uniref:hypothetical protein n=1 Tax=Mycobacterium tuberculosis TaxID=1773 RepID=UPI0027295DFE|nr:hypothetical protein [Mycobacterium tuberculosis]
MEVREESTHLIDLQIVAFPQEGIESFRNGRELMEEAIRLGADVIGGIPHFEYTRDQGVEVREESTHLIDLQIVAFPQEGIESFRNGRELMGVAGGRAFAATAVTASATGPSGTARVGADTAIAGHARHPRCRRPRQHRPRR